jgi:cysteine sulfinate desulfinase/cysteine desulfurase-like protein
MQGMLAEFIAIKLDLAGFLVSTGSACGSNKGASGTETLIGMGRGELKESTLRFSFGKFTKKSDITAVLRAFIKIMQG